MNVHSKIHSVAVCLTAVLSAMLLSCNEEDFNTNLSCDNICFDVRQGKNMTRANGINMPGEHLTDMFTLTTRDSADTLYVKTVESDNFESVSGTRGESVSSANFYDTFHVLAYWKKQTAEQSAFYMDVDVNKGTGDIYSSADTYFWPGAEHTLDFYAYAPVDAGFTKPATPASRTLAGYTVPADAVNQKDLVVAKSGEIPGDKNALQGLTFQHICTKVQFKVGAIMQAGKILSVSIKGVKNSGDYDMLNNSWTLGETTADFSQDINIDYQGGETSGDITSGQGTFMMLPQQLPANASIEVVFQPAKSLDKITLTGSIAGTNWGIGRAVTYLISITPEGGLQFVTPEAAKDAHYVIYPIDFVVGTDMAGNWTVSTDAPWVTLTGTLNRFEQNGYWTVDPKNPRSSSLTGNQKGLVRIYAFLEENFAGSIAQAERVATLKLRCDGSVAEFEITQLQALMSADNSNYFERLEETQSVQWGFDWTGDYIDITAKNGGNAQGLVKDYWSMLADKFPKLFSYDGDKTFTSEVPYITVGASSDVYFLRIDLSSFYIDIKNDWSDGWKNTYDLYYFKGLSDLEAMINTILEGTNFLCNGLNFTQTETAAFMEAVKRNKFRIEYATENNLEVIKLVLDDDEFNWYLPAYGQMSNWLQDPVYPLQGDYWTSSTANQVNFSMVADYNGLLGPNAEMRRNNLYKIRALRRTK